jgi:transposase
MARKRFEISEQQEQAMQQAYRQTKDAATRTRYQAVMLYSQGYSVAEICQITGCHRNSLMEWCRKYRQQGVTGLTDRRGGPHRAKLSAEQVEALRQKLEMYRPHEVFGPESHTVGGQHWTVEDLADAIHHWYGVVFASRSSYHGLFARCGFTYQRTEKVYKSRRERAVMDFEAQVEKN